MLIRNAAHGFAGVLIIAVCAFGQFNPTNGFTTTSSSSFPPVGIGSTETVQVILSNTAVALSNAAVVSTEPAPSCKGSVAFYNASGTIIGTATSFALTTGQITQVSLSYTATTPTSVREMIRAVVSLTTTFPGPAPCSLSYSLATFDTASGATHATITGSGISALLTPLLGHL
jgi:hypothetical protein